MIKGIDFRRGFFNLSMFPHLSLINRIKQSQDKFHGGAVRICMYKNCERWQPYIDNPHKDEWQEPITLKYIQSKLFPGMSMIKALGELNPSHGICPKCMVIQEKHLESLEIVEN